MTSRAFSVWIAGLVFAVGMAGLAWAQAQLTPVQKAEVAAKQTAEEKAVAERIFTEKKSLADRSAAVQTAAEQAVVAARNSVEKAAAAAKTAQGDAAKAAKEQLEKGSAALKAAEEAATAIKAAAEKAAAERAAAEKSFNEKSAAAENAARKVLAEKAFAANMAIRQAHSDRAAAEKTLAEKSASASKVAADKTAAEQANTSAANEKAAADRILTEKAAAAKAAAEKANAEQDANKKKALAESAGKAEAERVTAEKAVLEKASVVKAAGERLATATNTANQANAEKTAAEQALAQRVAAITARRDEFAIAEAEALGGLKPITSALWDYAKARHLLFRAGFGGSPQEVEKLLAMGPHSAVDYLVNYHDQPECNLIFDVRRPERPMQYEAYLEQNERDQLNNERTGREQSQQYRLRQWWLRRMAETQRPLEEKLTLFWHDHFATGYEDKLYQSQILHQQNELFRINADKYDALLRGIVHDPAMIIYLDNQVNIKGRGNENLGREVLELFSLGRDQGYTEQDLRELARALTGFTYVPYTNQFRFNLSQHDEKPKSILGQTGTFSADEAIDIILQHPSTARYTAKKLFEFFAHRQPSVETVDRLAHVLRSNSYELAPMLRNLFLSEEFYSERSMAQQIKSPAELMIGTVRVLGINDVNYGYIDGMMQAMGMTLFQPPNVAGWEEGRSWISANAVLLRYNGVANLVEQPGADIVALVEGRASSPVELVDYLARACLVVNLNETQRKELAEFLGPLPPPSEWPKQRDQINAKLRALLVLLLSTPEYQVS
jgi:hypothetical protein